MNPSTETTPATLDSTPTFQPSVADPQPPVTPELQESGHVAPKSDTGGSTLNPDQSEPRQSDVGGQPTIVRSPNETPRAFGAFSVYFQLGNNRSLQAVAEKTGEQLPTVKNWSSKFDWNERIHLINSGLLQTQIDAEKAAREKAAADWARRNTEYREQEWESGQELMSIVRCCFGNFGDRDLEKMRLSELSRALTVAAKMSRAALQDPITADSRPSLTPLQNELLALLHKMPAPQSPYPSEGRVPRAPNPSTPSTHTHN